MRFQGNFSTCDLESKTWYELEKYYIEYLRQYSERQKIFFNNLALRNIESFRLARFGSESEIRRYAQALTETPQENDIDAQFEGVKFE